MLLPDNLLNPISGANPSGEYLRYAATSKRDPTHFYDKLDELRREEEAVSDWQEAGKKADYDQVIKLATDALANRTKDVWIASRLTEALLKKHGFEGFKEGLELLRGLVETFWDTLYPELEDGDSELRATPLEWIATRFGNELRRVPLTRPKPPLTKSGFNWFDWEPTTGIPTEEAASASEGDRAKRDAAIAEKKVTPEEFGEAFAATPKADYKAWAASLDGIEEAMDALDGVCQEKFGSFAPSFADLRRTIDNDLKRAVRVLLKAKLEVDPDVVEEADEAPAAEEEPTSPETAEQPGDEGAAEPRTAARKATVTIEPADRDDAIHRLEVIARYLRQQEPYSPVPYLILRGLRWGELRASGVEIDQLLCEAPPTEIRQQIKRAAIDGNWPEVLEAAETAMGMPCGRAWLDLHRYVIKACTEQGSYYDPIAASVRSALKSLLTDYPQLSSMTLMDDTATANAETLAWLKEEIVPPPPEPATAEPSAAAPETEMPALAVSEEREPAEEGPPDAYELATNAARQGRAQEAISILSAATAQERSGRARFHRKVQLAGICMATGNEAVAFPILVELSNEVERLKLDEWESPETVAQPLVLLYQCLSKLGRGTDEKQRVYDRICRLDPAQALNCR